jgi:hypothetical protein
MLGGGPFVSLTAQGPDAGTHTINSVLFSL